MGRLEGCQGGDLLFFGHHDRREPLICRFDERVGIDDGPIHRRLCGRYGRNHKHLFDYLSSRLVFIIVLSLNLSSLHIFICIVMCFAVSS